MDDEHDRSERTQRLPKTGIEIPLPDREDVLDALRRASEPDETDEDSEQPPIEGDDSA